MQVSDQAGKQAVRAVCMAEVAAAETVSVAVVSMAAISAGALGTSSHGRDEQGQLVAAETSRIRSGSSDMDTSDSSDNSLFS
jgi:hypothetical protein